MAQWLYEAGIGEARAALVADGAIIEARIERPGVRAGAVLPARLVRALPETGRALVRLAHGDEALLDGTPARVAEGGPVRVVILREAIPEEGRLRLATARIAPDDAPDGAGATLAERIAAGAYPVRTLLPHEADALEAAGWSDVLDAAATGLFPFAGGLLRLSLTPAMTLFDVDGGGLSREALAIAGAAAAARTIRLLDIAGSIGIDLPTVGRDARAAAAAALDAALPQPFERTAVNGFGFLQLVRRRTRASLPELLAGDRVTAAALALLRRAARTSGSGARTLTAAPAIVARIAGEPGWIDATARLLGAPLVLRADATLAISDGYVGAEHP